MYECTVIDHLLDNPCIDAKFECHKPGLLGAARMLDLCRKASTSAGSVTFVTLGFVAKVLHDDFVLTFRFRDIETKTSGFHSQLRLQSILVTSSVNNMCHVDRCADFRWS